MRLITADGIVPDHFTSLTDDAKLPDSGGAIVSLARFQSERNALLARNARLGVRLKSDQSPELLGDDLQRFSVVALEFPKFRDGRPFSWARLLRTRLAYRGEIRAVGDFLLDQLAFQRRAGFDAWEVADGFGFAEFSRALAEISQVYQPSADGRPTIRDLRLGRSSS
jgi:uncharacterized protein (DUF934 family)